MDKEKADADAAAVIIARLGLQAHPEGGWYHQTWVGGGGGGGGGGEDDRDTRAAGTCIHFLLRAGEASHWHRVDADEIWLYHAGAEIALAMSATAAGPAQMRRLGPDVPGGAAPQIVVPKGWWQAARSTGGWTLVSCVVVPGFRFEGFDLAAPGFDIPR